MHLEKITGLGVISRIPITSLKVMLRRCFFIILATIAFTGCLPNDDEPLRLAVNAWPGYAYFAAGRDAGFFSRPELPELRIIETTSLIDSVRLFERGKVDMIGGTLAELAHINRRGRREAKGVLVLNRSVGGDMIVSEKSIKTLHDLRGQRVALEPDSANTLVLAAALSQSALSFQDIQLVAIPQSELALAHRKDRWDAAVSYPPVSEELLKLPGLRRLFDTSQAPDAVVDLLIVATETVRERSGALKALIDAHNRTLVWSRSNSSESRELIAKHTGLTPRGLKDIEKGIEMLTIEEQSSFWQNQAAYELAAKEVVKILSSFDTASSTLKGNFDAMLDSQFVMPSEIR